MKLSKSYLTTFFLLIAFVFVSTLATFRTASAQSYQTNHDRSHAAASVPGIIDGFNELFAGQSGNFESGAISQTSHLIALPYTHPVASGIGYIASLKNNFTLAPKAYAQAAQLGYNGLLPVQPLWTIFRNIAYLGFVLMFIIIGLMIMMRVKIDPRTVVSVQQAIPSIVIGLILVTFSYAIVGFMIDLMNLFIALIVQIFVQQGILCGANPNPGPGCPTSDSPPAQITLFTRNLTDIVRAFWGSEINGVADSLGNFIDKLVGDVFGGIVGNLAGLISGGVMKLILMIAVMYAAIRTFISMIMAYVTVIILTIIGPLQIMIGVIPGQSGAGFGKWFRNVAGNLAIFPVVAFLILLAAILTNSGDIDFSLTTNAGTDIGANSNNLWKPPLLLGGINNADDIRGIVGLGILLLIPSAAQMTKDLFKTGAFAYGAAIGATVGGAASTLRGPFRPLEAATGEALKEGGAKKLREATGRIFSGHTGGGRNQ